MLTAPSNLTHHDVDVCRVHPPVLAAATPRATQRPNAVRLIQVEVRLVLLLHLDDLFQGAGLTLHAVDALDDDQNLVERLREKQLA